MKEKMKESYLPVFESEMGKTNLMRLESLLEKAYRR